MLLYLAIYKVDAAPHYIIFFILIFLAQVRKSPTIFCFEKCLNMAYRLAVKSMFYNRLSERALLTFYKFLNNHPKLLLIRLRMSTVLDICNRIDEKLSISVYNECNKVLKLFVVEQLLVRWSFR